MIHAGIDLHSNNMVIVAINDKNKVVREAKLPSSKQALDDFLARLTGRFRQLSNARASGTGSQIGARLTISS